MSLAATMLEDQEFIGKFLHKSRTLLLQNRLLAEELLRQAGIGFHDKGYENVLQCTLFNYSDDLISKIVTGMQAYSCGLI